MDDNGMVEVGQVWIHKKKDGPEGELISHNTETGRVVLKLLSGLLYRGRVGNLKEKWRLK
jgi:hypothetical protein